MIPGGEAVDGRLIEPRHGAERPGHQVHLVLEDEVGGPQPGDAHRPGRREALGRGVGVAFAPVLAVGAVEVGVAVAVALAAALHPAEQVGQRAVPRQLGELVDGGDHQGREQPVDLRVDGDDGQPLAGSAGRRERALPGAAEHQEPGGGRVVLAVVARVDGPPAPRAVAQLEGRGRGLAAVAAEALALHPVLGVLVLVGGDRPADPHAQPEGRALVAAVALGPAPAQQLGRAHQRGRPLELLGGQQAQGVAHQHGHAVSAVHRVGSVAHRPLQAAHGHGVGHQAQVGLGLAAPGGEEQQVGPGGAGPPVGVAGVGQRRQAQQDEGELERPPRAVLDDVGGGDGLRQRQTGVGSAPADGDGVDALLPHGLVGEPEGVERVGVFAHQLDAAAHGVGHSAGFVERGPGRVLVAFETGLGVGGAIGLGVEPVPVAVGQRQQSLLELVGLQLGQRLHVGDQTGELGNRLGLGGDSAPHLVAGQHRGADPGGSAAPGPAAAAGVGLVPFDADSVAHGQLDPIPVLHVEDRPFGPLGLGHVGGRVQDRLPAEEHGPAVG